MRGLTGGAGGRAHRGARHRRGLFWELAGDGQGELRRPGAVSCRPSRTQRWEHRPARPAQWGHNALHPAPPLLGTAPRTPPRPPTPYLLPLLALPQRDEPGQQHGQHAGGSAPHIGGERGVRGPPDGGTERFGLTDFCSHPARRRGNSGGAAGPGQAPAGGGARGAVSLTVCAPWGGHCAAGGAPRFFGFFFFSSLYFDLLCFGLLGGFSVCFLISFFYFFMLGWGGAGDSWQCHLYLAAVCGPQAAI